MKALVTTLLVSLMAVSAWAGDNGGGSIECVSSSGRTSLNGAAGTNYNGYGHADLTLAIDGKKLQIGEGITISRNGVASVDAVVFDPASKVYTVKVIETIEYDGGFKDTASTLELFADANTFKAGSYKGEYKFNATLRSVDPRKVQKESLDGRLQYNDNDIKVSCVLDVSL